MTSESINTSINNKVQALMTPLLNADVITSMCKAVSFDERRGIALLRAYPSHPLWNRGEYENVEDWSLEMKLTYLVVHGFTPEQLHNFAYVDKTKGPNPDLFEREYDVVVRAIASMEEPIPAIIEWSIPWNIYAHESSDDNVTVRLDTVIRVKANSKEEAIEIAKDSAPALGVDLEMDITIWVDTDQEEDVREVKS